MLSVNVGDKVHVEFDAVVTEAADNANGRRYTHTLKEVGDDLGAGTVHYVYLHSDNAEVVETEPSSWPPQVGDVWEAAGNEYFAYQGILGGVTIYPFDGTSGDLGYYESETYLDGRNLNTFKTLKPKLIRRREVSNLSAFGDYVTEYLSNYKTFLR